MLRNWPQAHIYHFLKIHGGLGRSPECNCIVSLIYIPIFLKCYWKLTEANHHKNLFIKKKTLLIMQQNYSLEKENTSDKFNILT